jgi:beta-barrel assembly-enhancing protease
VTRWAWCLVSLVLLGSFTGAWADMGDDLLPGQRPPAGSDEDELWYAMERAEQDLRLSPLRVKDEPLQSYVRNVACRVAADYCEDMRVYIVEQPWFNASMAPNGMMMVWTGALLRMRDEAELAVVLGHEFAHFRARHSLQQWRKTKRTSAVMGTFSIATLGIGYGLVGLAGQAMGMASLSGHSREREREADAEGLSAAVAAGYDPHAAADVWLRMQREEAASPRSDAPPVFASHPDTRDRVVDVTQAADQYHSAERFRGEDAYYAATRPHLDRWLQAELSRRMYDVSIQLIEGLAADARDSDRAVFLHYLGEAHRLRGNDGDDEAAADYYARAVRLPDAPPAAYREHAMVLKDRGVVTTARHMFRHYLKLLPEAEDRAFIEFYLADMESAP